MTSRDRLIELLDDGCYKACSDKSGKKVNEFLADFLLKNGVNVPLCKIGDTVYEIRVKNNFWARERDCRVDAKSRIVRGDIYDTFYVQPKAYTKSDGTRMNATVFLTREDAENAIKEYRNNDRQPCKNP